jgi:hypothetical protein
MDRPPFRLWPRPACYRSMIRVGEGFRAWLAMNANARPVILADIIDDLAVPSFFTLQKAPGRLDPCHG